MNEFANPRRLIAVLCVLSLAVAGTSAAVAAGLAQSASKVDAIATYANAGEAGQEIRVQLDITDGWHVNTHPASLDFLVATSIKATVDGETVPLTVAWPEGHDSGIELGGTEIKVYHDGTVLPVQLDTAAAIAGAHPTLKIRVQSCSDKGLCLPPSTLTVEPGQS